MDSTEKPEVPVASEKSISDQDIIKEFIEFEAQMKYKYGSKASAITMNLFAQGGGKRGERVEFERDYFLIGMSLVPVSYSVTLVNNWLQSNGFESSVILWSSIFLNFLVVYCIGISLYHNRLYERSVVSSKPIVDSLAACSRCPFPPRDITTEFVEFETTMKSKYGEKTTATTMKLFAQASGELYAKERFHFAGAITLIQLAFSAFPLYLTLSELGYDFPLLAYFSICCHFLGLLNVSNDSTMDSTEEPEVSVASEKSISDQDIFTEFAEIEAKLKEKYGKKATATVIAFFALGGKKRHECLGCEHDNSHIGWVLSMVGYFIQVWYLNLRLGGSNYPLLSYLSCFFHFLAVCFWMVRLYRSYYSQ